MSSSAEMRRHRFIARERKAGLEALQVRVREEDVEATRLNRRADEAAGEGDEARADSPKRFVGEPQLMGTGDTK